MKNRSFLAFLLGALPLAVTAAQAGTASDFAAHPVDHDATRYTLMSGLGNSRWPDNSVPWYYNPAGAPLAENDALAAIQAATATWTAAGGVTFRYMGTTDQALSNGADDKLVIGWLDATTFTNRFGDYSGYASIWWSGGSIIDGEMSLNAGGYGMDDPYPLQGLVTHEMGHLLGIDHSDVAESVMFANPYNSAEYMRTLRTDDLDALALLYPGSGTTDSGTTDSGTTASATIAFSGLQTRYEVGDTLDVRLQEAGDGTTAVDLWFAIELPGAGGLLFATASGLGGQAAPLYSGVTVESSLTFSLLNLTVPSGIGGDYTLYAVYTPTGVDPLNGGPLHSNLAVARITLGN
ncbi:matrixin family metalloprotease [Endothiovibrio diazotrophicus]